MMEQYDIKSMVWCNNDVEEEEEEEDKVVTSSAMPSLGAR